MHLELQQPTNCNLTVLISSAEITFGKIVIQALMASSVRPPRNEQVVLPTSQYQPAQPRLAQPSQEGQVLNLGRSHEFGRNIKRASTNVGGVQARPLRYSCRACPSNINPWNAYYPLAKVDRLMDGPVLAARAAAASGGGDGLEGWSAGLKCVFNSLENLPPDDPTALYYTMQWCVIWDLICMEIYFSYFWPAFFE